MAFDLARMQQIADDSSTWAAAQNAGGDGLLTKAANDTLQIGKTPVVSHKAGPHTPGGQ